VNTVINCWVPQRQGIYRLNSAILVVQEVLSRILGSHTDGYEEYYLLEYNVV
jgi:hypothetical protein